MKGDSSYRSPPTKGGRQTVHRLQNAIHPRFLNGLGPAPYRPFMNQPSGFTLIELVVTIAIAGILLALAVPSFRDTLLNNQRAARVNEFIADLNYARSEAVLLRRPVVVCRTDQPNVTPPVCGGGDGWEEGWIIFVDRSGNGTPEAADATIDIYPPAGVGAEDAILRRHEPLITSGEADLDPERKFILRGNNNVADSIVFTGTGTSTTNGSLVACDSRDDFGKGRVIVVNTGGRTQSLETSDSRVSPTVTDCIH